MYFGFGMFILFNGAFALSYLPLVLGSVGDVDNVVHLENLWSLYQKYIGLSNLSSALFDSTRLCDVTQLCHLLLQNVKNFVLLCIRLGNVKNHFDTYAVAKFEKSLIFSSLSCKL